MLRAGPVRERTHPPSWACSEKFGGTPGLIFLWFSSPLFLVFPKPRAAQGTEEAISENMGAMELCYL